MNLTNLPSKMTERSIYRYISSTIKSDHLPTVIRLHSQTAFSDVDKAAYSYALNLMIINLRLTVQATHLLTL